MFQAAIQSAVVDPRKFLLDSEYLYAQRTAWAFGQAYSDLLTTIENKVKEAEYLTEKEQGKHPDKFREAMS
jgi:hypothetical protein